MKNTFVKAIAIALALVTVACVFASCGKTLKGTYEADAFGTGTSLTFKGSKVTVQFKLFGSYGDPIEGKYEIKDNKITITFADEDADDAKNFDGTFDFEEGEDYIKIGAIKYRKAD